MIGCREQSEMPSITDSGDAGSINDTGTARGHPNLIYIQIFMILGRIQTSVLSIHASQQAESAGHMYILIP